MKKKIISAQGQDQDQDQGQGQKEVVGLEGIELHRENRMVLEDIHLSIQSGQHWVLLGPNGSGKSSLLSVLQGILWPIEGQVRVLGRKFGESDLTEMRQFIGFVGNEIEPEFPAWQTVLEIALSGSVGTVGLKFDQPQNEAIKRARLLLRQVGMLSLAHRRIGFLSQGQKRLATIVRALMVRPGLLILDEPASGLDPVAREGFLTQLNSLMALKSGPIILYVTHHVEEIIPAFTHVLMLKKGRIAAQGAVKTCLNAKNLSQVFGRKIRLVQNEDRYSIRLLPHRG